MGKDSKCHEKQIQEVAMKERGWMAIGVAFACLFLSLPGTGIAAEKKFPTKAIQVIIPFQPGETDNMLRPFIEKMPEYLGQPMNLVYKPGAAGSVGAGFVAGSKPDGYTLLGSSLSSVVLVPLTNKDIGYSQNSFAPVSCLALGYLMFAVQSNARWKNIHELVAEAKQNPAKISYASTGTFGNSHLAGAAFCNAAGINLNHIPAQGSGPAVTAMLGGHVDIAVTGPGPSIPHIRTGTVRALIIFNEKRVRDLPQVPTASEMGFPVVIPNFYGLLAPQGTPKEVVEAIHLASKKVLEKHEAFIDERLSRVGAHIGFMEPEQYASLLIEQQKEYARILKVIKP